jgi:ADP-heptose:LPS heptosyltransferase
MKILIFRNDRLGDLIVTTPLLKLIKKIDNVKITLVASNTNLKLAQNYINLIDECIILEKNFNFLDKIKIYQKLKKHKYDHVIILRQNTLNMFFAIIFYRSVFGILSIDNKANTNIFNRSFYYYLSLFAKHKEIIDWRTKTNDITHVSKHYINLALKSNIFNFKTIDINSHYISSNLNFEIPFFSLKNNLRIKSIFAHNYIHLHLDQKWFRTNASDSQIINMIKELSCKINQKHLKLVISDDNNNFKVKNLLINKYFKKSINKNFYLADNENLFVTNSTLSDITSLIFLSKLTVTFHSGYVVHTANSLDKKLIDFHEKTENIVYKKWMSWQKDSKQYTYESLDDVVEKIINEI